MGKIVVAGSFNMDLSVRAAHIPAAGETILGGGLLESPGGKGANQAYAAAKLMANGEVVMLGCVGEDEFGARMLANLAAAGCNVSHAARVPGPSGVALIIVSDQGENAIVVAPGANSLFTEEWAGTLNSVLQGASALLLQLEIPLNTVLALAKAAHAAGVPVILDPAPAPDNGLPAELLNLTTIITPNESEAASLTGITGQKMTAELALQSARRLMEAGCKAVVLKLGARGCLFHQEGGDPCFIPAPKVNVVDTTAAGDIFNAALAVALSEEQELAAACLFATRAAALSVTRQGAQLSAPSRQEVLF